MHGGVRVRIWNNNDKKANTEGGGEEGETRGSGGGRIPVGHHDTTSFNNFTEDET